MLSSRTGRFMVSMSPGYPAGAGSNAVPRSRQRVDHGLKLLGSGYPRGMLQRVGSPIRVALVDDCQLVAAGLTQMLANHARRVEVVAIDGAEVRQRVDIALHDGFAPQGSPRGPTQPGPTRRTRSAVLERLLLNPLIGRTVIYTWNVHPALAERAIQEGASGVLSKTLSARGLVEALEQVHGGRIVVSPPPRPAEGQALGGPEGLSSRESEVLGLITQGLSNAEIAKGMYLSPNSVKSYIRSAYRKIGVVRRSQAVAWGMQHGLHGDYLPAGAPTPAEKAEAAAPPKRYLSIARPA